MQTTTATMHEEELRFLHGDLRAAAWVLQADPDWDDATLGRRFLSIHQYLVRNAGRERPGLLRDVLRKTLSMIVRRWIVLYRTTIHALSRRHPRTATSRDLVIWRDNWSAVLGIDFEGIVQSMSAASRYAEYWAERSVRDPVVARSLVGRLRFVDTLAYWHVHQLKLSGRLVVVDAFENHATSYDLVARAHDGSLAAQRACWAEEGWEVRAMDAHVAAVLAHYHREGPNALWGPDETPASRSEHVGAGVG